MFGVLRFEFPEATAAVMSDEEKTGLWSRRKLNRADLDQPGEDTTVDNETGGGFRFRMQFDMQAVRGLALATHTQLAFIRSMNIMFSVLLITMLVTLVACLIICSIALSKLGQVEDILGKWASTN